MESEIRSNEKPPEKAASLNCHWALEIVSKLDASAAKPQEDNSQM
jgi:hypothetical protein